MHMAKINTVPGNGDTPCSLLQLSLSELIASQRFNISKLCSDLMLYTAHSNVMSHSYGIYATYARS